MSITPLPPAPAPTDSTQQFNEKAFDWVASLGDFTTEANALAVAVTHD
jgi:predicted phosphodiesterase